MENMLEAFTVKEYFSEGMTVTDVASACQRLADSGDTRYYLCQLLYAQWPAPPSHLVCLPAGSAPLSTSSRPWTLTSS